MKWILFKEGKPKIGQKIYGRDTNGESILGTYGEYHGFSRVLLDLKGRSVLLWQLTAWAKIDKDTI